MTHAHGLKILPYGPGGLLVETSDLPPAALAGELRKIPGVIDAVPGARTVLITFDAAGRSEREAVDSFTRAIGSLARREVTGGVVDSPEVRIPVRYDGEDLEFVAQQAAMAVGEVIERHSRATYRVAFMGFAPGFGYLEGLDPRLELPRLASPRTSVPAGAVAIAGKYAAVYPRSSPGGWLLIGHTPTPLFDEAARPPALLAPGTRVRFEAA